MNNNDIRKIKNGGIIGHNDQRDDKEGGNEVGRNNRNKNTWIKRIEMRSGPVRLEWVWDRGSGDEVMDKGLDVR